MQNTSRVEKTTRFFVAGGALPPDAPCYVPRPADDALFEAVRRGEFCAVFAPHDMGKSSLALRTAHRLREAGHEAILVDVSGTSPETTVEQMYRLLLRRLTAALHLSTDPESWWDAHAGPPPRRFVRFLQEVVLPATDSPLAIFVDGIAVPLNVDFFDGFLSVLRHLHAERAAGTPLARLTFVLMGVASLAALVKDPARTPLDFVRQIELRDFDPGAETVLRQGLAAATPAEWRTVFERVYYWTNGHPYLTQKLLAAIARMWDRHWTEERIDGLVERLFRTGMYEDSNLQSVIDALQRSERRGRLLRLYAKIRREGRVQPHTPDGQTLQLLGLVHPEGDTLRVRNRVYHLAFDGEWMRTLMPFNWLRGGIIAAAVLLFLLLVAGGFFLRQRQVRASQTQALVQRFAAATTAEERVVALAELFQLGGTGDRARQLFFEDLPPDEQLALFNLANPHAVGKELVTVVRGLYTTPNLYNHPRTDALLEAMTRPMYRLENTPQLGTIELDLEITQWLKGRTLYAQGAYRQALDAFNVGLTMNSRNPGIYFDRAKTYAALSQPEEALSDFAEVVKLDDRWQGTVLQAILDDPALYAVLWSQQGDYPRL
ncbi:MAG: hypothetical protein D6796_16285, partial [Caldilineae bacterium]